MPIDTAGVLKEYKLLNRAKKGAILKKKRRKLTKQESKKLYKKGAKTHIKNLAPKPSRGGIRL